MVNLKSGELGFGNQRHRFRVKMGIKTSVLVIFGSCSLQGILVKCRGLTVGKNTFGLKTFNFGNLFIKKKH